MLNSYVAAMRIFIYPRSSRDNKVSDYRVTSYVSAQLKINIPVELWSFVDCSRADLDMNLPAGMTSYILDMRVLRCPRITKL